MNKNNNLHSAKKEKNNEFYTQLSDIEKEMASYDVSNFQGKVIYCNCDDYRFSNFCKCFKDNFEYLGIKKVMATNYDIGDGAYKWEYDGENETVTELEGNGGFETAECIEFLKEADVVVTNPPFSLFRAYVKQLMDYGKKFLVIGNQNAITYKEIQPYIKNNELWLGTSNNNGMYYLVSNDYEYSPNYKFKKEIDGKKVCRVPSVCWFTNIENKRRNMPIDLYKKFNKNEYPKYDNFEAIDVKKVELIPTDYDGVMGVPITFLYKYCPKQFEILAFMTGAKGSYLVNGNDGRAKFYINNVGVYARILIRKIK